MEFKEFLENQEKMDESLWGLVRGGWNTFAGGMTMADETLAKMVGQGRKGRFGNGAAQFGRGLHQIVLGDPKDKKSQQQPVVQRNGVKPQSGSQQPVGRPQSGNTRPQSKVSAAAQSKAEERQKLFYNLARAWHASSGHQKKKLQDTIRRVFPDQNEEILLKPETRKIMARIMSGGVKR